MEKVIYKFDAENFTTQPRQQVHVHLPQLRLEKDPSKIIFNLDPKFKIKILNVFIDRYTKSNSFSDRFDLYGDKVMNTMNVSNKCEIICNKTRNLSIIGYEPEDYESIFIVCSFVFMNCSDSEQVLDMSMEMEGCGKICAIKPIFTFME